MLQDMIKNQKVFGKQTAMKRIMSWLRLAFALAATALYGVTIAPLQTIVTIASADAETRDYFAHVGLRAHLGCLMIRFPTSALRIPWHSPIIRALFRIVAIVERKFFVARGTRIVDSTDERVKGIWTQSDEENRARALSSHVLMYIHGGGFVTGHPGFYTGMASTMVAKFNERMKLSGETLAIFCPEYPLCPENSFDEILASLVDSYKMLVALGYTKISIAGDSAGGNAALNLVSILSMDYGYLLQPYSAVIFSPWVDPFVTYLPPEPCPFDIMTVQDSRFCAAVFSKTASLNTYFRVSPIQWEKTFSSCVPKSGGLLCIYSEAEVLYAGIYVFLQELQNTPCSDKVFAKCFPHACHCFHVGYLLFGGHGKRLSLEALDDTVEFLST
ncbi:hypothetical protein HDU83_005330 [Entophlyctis luteolus]|nr:hypothetical protein HDU83_005330 [Entophlyctis luteolus]